MGKYLIIINHRKSIEILSKVMVDKSVAEKELKKIRSKPATMFSDYSKAKVFELKELDV
ncbi:MAG: hypothetical protein Q4P25_04150 [Tissierellia bacterium]|nr:hypothetical protein [Tissierellia bacterium]